MVSATLTDTQACLDFFQKRILRAVEYWSNHEAVKKLQIAYLDKEREAILKAISLGLQFEAAWPIVRLLIIALTPYMERRGHWDAWRTVLERAVEVAQRVGDLDNEVTLTALMARLSQRQSRPKDVVYYYRQVIRLARQTENRFEEARACSNLGYFYVDSGNWWRAEVLNKHALAIFESLESDHGRAHTHNHLGAVYTRQHLWDSAEHHLRQACDLWQKMPDDHSLIHGYGNLGSLYFEMQCSDKALIYLQKAIDQAQLTGEESHLGTFWMNMGITYIQKENFASAKSYVRQAERRFKKFSNSLGMAQAWHNLGVIAVRETNWREAGIILKRSMQAYRELQNHDGVLKVLITMIEYELEKKNYIQGKIYLDELSSLMNQYSSGQQLQYFQQRLEEFHQTILAR
ncbi:tetratricopeptide repeat protein [Chloroflexi bacterium TSY]|nr:tetratricopeptide repeat protein [Chloroflexi bacterium TSY]